MSAPSPEVTWTGAWMTRVVIGFHDQNPDWNGLTPALKAEAVADAQALRDRLMANPEAVAAIVYYTALQAVLDADEAVL